MSGSRGKGAQPSRRVGRRDGGRTRAWLALVALLGGCFTGSKVQVSSESAPVDLSSARTYDYVRSTSEKPGAPPSLFDWRVQNAVDRALAARGLERVSSGEPDLRIGYQATIRQTEIDTVAEYRAYRSGGGTRDLGETYVFGYPQGTLVIDVFDARSGRLVWRGQGQAPAEAKTDAQRAALVDRGVASILASYPGR